jgi:4-hydroxy-2-oxoheptanedioate aldolase
MPIRLNPTLRDELAAAKRPLIGMWLSTGSPLVAEICAGSGLDWVLIDAEHGPNDLTSILPQLQALAAYPVTTLVRPPIGDTVLIKQYLEIGVQNLLIPLCDTAEHAADLVSAVRYPPQGVRGAGSSLGRASRWGRVKGYMSSAGDSISLYLQIETVTAVGNVEAILAVDGVDGVFLGPSDLAASMGHPGEQDHQDVVAAVERCLGLARAAGKPAGVYAPDPVLAARYLAAGASFACVGADVGILARGTEDLAARFIDGAGA